MQQFDGTIESSQAKVFQKHYSEMRQTGQVADEVCDAFGIEQGLSVNELLAEMGVALEVTKKGRDTDT